MKIFLSSFHVMLDISLYNVYNRDIKRKGGLQNDEDS